MKKFFLNKKLMTAVLSLCLMLVIGGIAVFAAFQSGLPGIDRIMGETVLPEGEQSSESSSEENSENIENGDVNLNDVTINPVEPSIPEAPDVENIVDGPIVYRAPDRMMAITLTAGVDFYTDPSAR